MKLCRTLFVVLHCSCCLHILVMLVALRSTWSKYGKDFSAFKFYISAFKYFMLITLHCKHGKVIVCKAIVRPVSVRY